MAPDLPCDGVSAGQKPIPAGKCASCVLANKKGAPVVAELFDATAPANQYGMGPGGMPIRD
eukprot:8425925-Alexandrium_andersonii.AAC.1